MISNEKLKIEDIIMTCEICNEKSANPEHKDLLICDECNDYFECMTEANDALGDAWSSFEKVNSDKICTECIDCGEWVALTKITENDSCPICGGDLYHEDN